MHKGYKIPSCFSQLSRPRAKMAVLCILPEQFNAICFDNSGGSKNTLSISRFNASAFLSKYSTISIFLNLTAAPSTVYCGGTYCACMKDGSSYLLSCVTYMEGETILI